MWQGTPPPLLYLLRSTLLNLQNDAMSNSRSEFSNIFLNILNAVLKNSDK